jgi:hypothetical protein
MFHLKHPAEPSRRLWSILRTKRAVPENQVKRVGLLSPKSQVKRVGLLVATEKGARRIQRASARDVAGDDVRLGRGALESGVFCHRRH